MNEIPTMIEGVATLDNSILDASIEITAVWMAGEPASARVIGVKVTGKEALALDLRSLVVDEFTDKITKVVTTMVNSPEAGPIVQFDA